MSGKIMSILENNGKDKIKFPIIGEESKASKKLKTPEKKKKKSSSKKWIISTSIFIICLILIWHFSQNNNKTNNNVPSATITTENQISKGTETRVLNVGVYNFEMKTGEETGWIQMPDRGVRYRIGSPDDRWIIIFDDGKTVKGWDSEPIPPRDLAKFKIKSLQNQCVRITIIEN